MNLTSYLFALKIERQLKKGINRIFWMEFRKLQKRFVVQSVSTKMNIASYLFAWKIDRQLKGGMKTIFWMEFRKRFAIQCVIHFQKLNHAAPKFQHFACTCDKIKCSRVFSTSSSSIVMKLASSWTTFFGFRHISISSIDKT